MGFYRAFGNSFSVGGGFFAFLILLLIYGFGIDGGLFFDDLSNLAQNELLKPRSFFFDDLRIAANSGFAGPLGRPVSLLTFTANYKVATDFIPWQLKLVNLLLHFSIGVLIHDLTRSVQKFPAACHQPAIKWSGFPVLVAAVWLLHPLHVSTVLYVVQRMAQLSTFFILVGLLVYCRARLKWIERMPTVGELLACLLWLLVCLFFAVFSKENGILLPWLVVLTEWLLFQGVWGGQSRRVMCRLAALACLLPLVMIGALLWLVPDVILDGYQNREFTFTERTLTQVRVLWQYVSWFFFPDIRQMALMHDDVAWSSGLLTPVTTLLSFLAWAVVLVAAILIRRKWPLFSFGVLFFLIGHSLESSVWPLEMAYEHRNYLPSLGLAILVALGVLGLAQRLPGARAPVLAGLVLLILAGLTGVRSSLWANEQDMFRFDVTNHPGSPRNHFFYANSLYQEFLSLPESAEQEHRLALIVTARKYFHRMHEFDPRDLAPVVKLYQIDSLYFSGRPNAEGWLSVLYSQVADRAIQASDRTALNALVDFVEQSPDIASRDAPQVDRILKRLLDRYERRADIWLLRYRLARTQGNEKAADNYLGRAIELDTNNYHNALAHRVREYLEKGDPRVYGAITDWFVRDQKRENLAVISRLVHRLEGAE